MRYLFGFPMKNLNHVRYFKSIGKWNVTIISYKMVIIAFNTLTGRYLICKRLMDCSLCSWFDYLVLWVWFPFVLGDLVEGH